MTNKELQELLSKFPGELEIEVYDRAVDAFLIPKAVRMDTIWSFSKGICKVVQITVEEKE